jgi:long-subunit acyl-CoA synthetase (AMP-forming)
MLKPSTHLYAAFSQAVLDNGPRTALAFKDHALYQHYSYADVDKQVTRLGNLLKALGVRPQDKVAIILNNSPE